MIKEMEEKLVFEKIEESCIKYTMKKVTKIQ